MWSRLGGPSSRETTVSLNATSAAFAETIASSLGTITRNATAPQLLEQAIVGGEGELSASGAFVALTGPFTGRSPKDKYIVRDTATADRVWWESNQAIGQESFARLEADFIAHIQGCRLFSQQLRAAGEGAGGFDVEVFTETAWHSLFIRNLLAPAIESGPWSPTLTILHLPSFLAEPSRHGTRGSVVIALDLSRNIVLIGGTAYAGEIKKAVFSVFNFHAPQAGILPMHCSANVGASGDTALFFGLSGTGKTTLSADPARRLIGDDEHGWGPDGVFNVEGGCYAKTAGLRASAEPEIHAATQRFGTVLENVILDGATRHPDYDDITLTENGRAAYPLSALGGADGSGTGAAPSNIMLLTADAFGVLPPIARLTTDQALYYFLSGYTAKLAGTERGVTEPQATFSVCFGAPFMPQHPAVYSGLLEKRLRESGAACWLINTGWTGGAYGVGRRIPLATTRRLLQAAIGGELKDVAMRRDAVFGLKVPESVEGVDDRLLDPRRCWSDGAAYDKQANHLLSLFQDNIRRFGPAAANQDNEAVQVAAE